MTDHWQRLGRLLIERRVELGYPRRLTWARETLRLSNDRILSDLERARRTNYDPATLAQVERMYQWAPGSIRAVLAGGEPTPVANPEATPGSTYRPLFEDDLIVDEWCNRMDELLWWELQYARNHRLTRAEARGRLTTLWSDGLREAAEALPDSEELALSAAGGGNEAAREQAISSSATGSGKTESIVERLRAQVGDMSVAEVEVVLDQTLDLEEALRSILAARESDKERPGVLYEAARTVGRQGSAGHRRDEQDRAGEPPADDTDDMEPR